MDTRLHALAAPLTEPDRDIHEVDAILADDARLEALLATPSAQAAFRPEKLRTIRGMGTIWDYRSFTKPNGGQIATLVLTQHIPVIRQMAGRVDLDVLWRVLVQQGLMVQRGTDGEGNVAKYTSLDRLCFQARGANALGPGVEHMHLTTAEKWTSKQLNAAAYVVWECHEKEGIPMSAALLGPGSGIVHVLRRGQTTHEDVSAKAGFHDRLDPGDGYPRVEVAKRARFFARHHSF